MKRLTEMKLGRNAKLVSVAGGQSIEKRLVDMGFLPGEIIKMIHNSGAGFVTVSVKGAKLALGHGLATKILVKEIV